MQKLAFVCALGIVLLQVLMSCGLYASGFFLTRFELKEHTQTQAGLFPQFNKTVILLVDALRFDFANYSSEATSVKYYQNKLPILHDTLMTRPNNTWLFQFIADPPTVTMQRIKGMMTGSLPTFIDFKDNFHSNAVEEDNFIWQCKQNHKRAIFIGDDTWVSLFPNDFAVVYPFDSFNVKDLDTVDTGVINNLPREMQGKNWTIIIGHMLGVDHIGHRYYADHPTMAQKLAQVNLFIEEIIENLPEDALLMVLGDHGMTEDGNHGGTSYKETNSALFAFSKRPFAYKSVEFPLKAHRSTLYQIDIVPTLSVLLGLPIPFNNLGSVILELFIDDKSALSAMYSNAFQVYTYLRTYDTQVKKLPDPAFEDLQNDFFLLKSQFESQKSSDLIARLVKFISEAAEMCRRIWTTFDTEAMSLGVCLLGLSLLFVMWDIIWELPAQDLWVSVIGVFSTLGLGVIWGLVWGGLIRIRQSLSTPGPHWSQDLTVSFVFQAMHGYCLFSNSYILKEDAVFRFLLLLILLYCSYTASDSSRNWMYLSCAFCIRASATFDPIAQKEHLTDLHFLDRFLMTNLVRFYLPMLVFLYLVWKTEFGVWRKSGNVLNCVLVGSYWILQDVGLVTEQSYLIKILIPRVVYVISLFGLISRDSKTVLIALVPALCLIGGVEFPIILLTVSAQLKLFLKAMESRESPLIPLFIYFTTMQFFYSSGHRCNFPSLQIASAFTGFETFNFYVSGTLLILNTGSCLFFLFSIYGLTVNLRIRQNYVLHVATASCVSLLMTTLNTFINRRHLMVWPIFAPKYIFDVGMSIGALSILFIGAVAFMTPEDTKKRTAD